MERSCANGGCEFARKHKIMGLGAGSSGVYTMEQFRQRVPLCTYSDIAAEVDMVAQTGCKFPRCTDPIEFLTSTTGTTGSQRLVPLTRIDMEKMRSYLNTCIIIAFSCRSTPNKVSKRVLEAAEWVEPAMYLHALWGMRKYSELSQISVPFSAMLHSFFTVMIRDWDDLIYDVEHGTLHRKVPPVQLRHEPMPHYASRILEAVSRVPPGKPGWVKSVFPKLNLVVSNVINPSLSYVSDLKLWLGDDVQFRSLVYGASECIIAMQTPEATIADLRRDIQPNSAFFEFVPLDEEESKKCTETGGAMLPQEAIVGHIYEVALTNFSGLWRYRMGDAVQVVGFKGQCPEIKFAYRVGSVLNIFGENINEIHLRKIMTDVFGDNIVDFTVFQDDIESRYHVYVEPRSPLSPETVCVSPVIQLPTIPILFLTFPLCYHYHLHSQFPGTPTLSHNTLLLTLLSNHTANKVSTLSEAVDAAIRQTVYNYRLYPFKKPLVCVVRPGTFASLTSHIQRRTLSQAKVPIKVLNPEHIKILVDNTLERCCAH
ncbi:GH3 auxin-responsive promoter family protein [Pelomyxa schiedti]|nr:GH3 auxin-responsive promoter family protein [Pelomyxa schiedti]